MSTNKSRHRVRSAPIPVGSAVQIPLGYIQSWFPSTQTWGPPVLHQNYTLGSRGHTFDDYQSTWDETHSPPYLDGGPFRSIRIVACEPFQLVNGMGTYYRLDKGQKYIGGFMLPDHSAFGTDVSITPINTKIAYNSPFFPSMADWGDKAYARLKPKIEQAGGAVFLAELRDLPRMLRTTSKGFHDTWRLMGGSSFGKIMQPKYVADHFLNIQFGWNPFLSDLKRFYATTRDFGKIVDRMERQNGQWVRRRVTLKSETTVKYLNAGIGNTLFPNTFFDNAQWMSGNALWQLREEKTTQISAVGKFRFYRPEFDKDRPKNMVTINRLLQIATLYGVRVNPSNIYKATPWTWAIDWISNTGDLIDHANDVAIDSVASKYVFLMQHEVTKRIFVQTIPFHDSRLSFEFVRIIDTKQREEGHSPYGFSLDVSNLTARQFAIAGALGLSRT